MITIERRRIEYIKARFPNLTDLGYIDDAFVVKLLAAEAIGCRPCDVRMDDVEIKEKRTAQSTPASQSILVDGVGPQKFDVVPKNWGRNVGMWRRWMSGERYIAIARDFNMSAGRVGHIVQTMQRRSVRMFTQKDVVFPPRYNDLVDGVEVTFGPGDELLDMRIP